MKRRILCWFCSLILGLSVIQLNPSVVDAKKAKGPKSELTDKKFIELYNGAVQKFRMGQIDQAIGVARNGMGRWPKSPRLLALLGYAYKSKKMYMQAVTYFNRAAKFFNKTEFFEKGQVLYNVAICYELQQQREAAVAQWQVFIAFAKNYNQELQSVVHAKKRIQQLRAVKK